MSVDKAPRSATALTWGLVAALVLSAAVTASRWLDVASPAVLLVQRLVPFAGLTAGALLAVLLMLQRWRLAAVAALVSAVHLALAVPHYLPSTVESSEDDLVVMAANLSAGATDGAELADAVFEHDVDLLVLAEVTPEALATLEDAGLGNLLPQSIGDPQLDGSGTVVLSRFPISGRGPVRGSVTTQPVVEVMLPAGKVTVVAAHAARTAQDGWRDDLASLAQWRADAGEEPLVIVGDFDAGSHQPAFREVAKTMTDAHEAAGLGWVRTWPSGGPVPAFAHLDHVLTRDVGVVDAGTAKVSGSDHAAVWARLAP